MRIRFHSVGPLVAGGLEPPKQGFDGLASSELKVVPIPPRPRIMGQVPGPLFSENCLGPPTLMNCELKLR